MKKTLLTVLVISGLLICSFTACSKEDAEEVVDTLPTCSGCHVQKVCETYEVDGESYIVCDDCYNEFATGMGLFDNVECSLCEVEKKCSVYEVDGESYIVCDDCYNEFATAFGIE